MKVENNTLKCLEFEKFSDFKYIFLQHKVRVDILKGHSVIKVTKTILIHTGHPTSLSLILSSLCGIGLDVIGKRVVWDGAKSNKTLSSLRFFSVEPFIKYFVSQQVRKIFRVIIKTKVDTSMKNYSVNVRISVSEVKGHKYI